MLTSTVINCTSLMVDQGSPLRTSSCGSHFGVQCKFSCMIGYRLNGSSTVTCVAPGSRPPGSWDNPLPICQGKLYRWQLSYNQAIPFIFTLGIMLNRAKMYWQSSSWNNNHDETTGYPCNICLFNFNWQVWLNGWCAGLRNLHFVWSKQCIFSNWSFRLSVAITCTSLPSPSNGVKTGCTHIGSETYNTHCSFTCNVGYTLVGSPARWCLENGTWSGDMPSCQG